MELYQGDEIGILTATLTDSQPKNWQVPPVIMSLVRHLSAAVIFAVSKSSLQDSCAVRTLVILKKTFFCKGRWARTLHYQRSF